MICKLALFVFAGSMATHAAVASTVTFMSTDASTSLRADIPTGTPTFVVLGSGLAYYVPSFVFNGSLTSGYIGFYNPNANDPTQPKGLDFAVFENLTGETFTFSGAQLYAGLESSPVYSAITTSVRGRGTTAIDGTVSFFDVPEPSSLALLGTALVSGCALRRRRA